MKKTPTIGLLMKKLPSSPARIYRMTIEGKGPYQIARELSEEKIERPSYYLGKKGLGNHASNYDKENPYMWRGNQVTTLIARPEYIGKTVNFRTFKNSYKDKKDEKGQIRKIGWF